ncbi:hypothetical protein MPU28_004824, partial [Escherichia coli]|nr:hypothetical protein [Escherichia coli]EJL8169002.1 hypothetical protein [Escherichia coli]
AAVDAQAMMQEKKTAFLFDAYMEKHSPKCVGPAAGDGNAGLTEDEKLLLSVK